MANSRQLSAELEQVISGDPWFGYPVMKMLHTISSENIHKRYGNAHTIAELLLHIIAWTEEVTERLKGCEAKEPVRGDWPVASGTGSDELITLFEYVHGQLLEAIRRFPEDNWNTRVVDKRGNGRNITFEQTVSGLIQHHIYHSGQIMILNKQFSTA